MTKSLNSVISFEDSTLIKSIRANLMTGSLRFMIAMTFIISGISKGANIEATAQLINQYCGLLNIDARFVISPVIIAVIICSFEIFIGMLTVNRNTFMMALPICTLTILGFAILACINLLSPMGGIESCGCFGELIHLNAKESFCKNIALLIATAYLIYKHKDTIRTCYKCITNDTRQLRHPFILYTIVSVFPICVSLSLVNEIQINRVSIYYLSCIISLIIVLWISLCDNATPSFSTGVEDGVKEANNIVAHDNNV